MIADRAAERIKAAITESLVGEHPIKAILDAYNPDRLDRATCGSRRRKTTAVADRSAKCHINYVVCDSDWEAEFCRAAEAHPRSAPTSRTRASASRCRI